MEKWYKPVAEFAGHIVAATLVFLMITGAAVGLSNFTHWLEGIGVDGKITSILITLEHIIFLVDVLLFGLWITGSAIHAFRAYWREWK